MISNNGNSVRKKMSAVWKSPLSEPSQTFATPDEVLFGAIHKLKNRSLA
jgi:hypothetical protein